MRWRCEICDTYNEEHDTVCYVCDQPRSEESIREAKKREREERIKRLYEAIYRRGYKILTVLFILALVVSVGATVASVIILQEKNELNVFADNFVAVYECAAQNVTVELPQTFLAATNHAGESLESFGLNWGDVSLNWGESLSTIGPKVEELIAYRATKCIVNCYQYRILPLIENCVVNFQRFTAGF